MTDIIVGSHIIFADGSKGVVVAYNDNEMTYLPTAQPTTIDLNTGIVFALDSDFLSNTSVATPAPSPTVDTVTAVDSGAGAVSTAENSTAGESTEAASFLADGGAVSADVEDSASTAVS